VVPGHYSLSARVDTSAVTESPPRRSSPGLPCVPPSQELFSGVMLFMPSHRIWRLSNKCSTWCRQPRTSRELMYADTDGCLRLVGLRLCEHNHPVNLVRSHALGNRVSFLACHSSCNEASDRAASSLGNTHHPSSIL
jgi:hypothetical protein